MSDITHRYGYTSVPLANSSDVSTEYRGYETPQKNAARSFSQREPRPWAIHIREWKWEIATWILSTCAAISIIALLASFKDKPVTNWTARFQLSTAIAALAQVAQSSLLVSVSSCIGQLKWPWLKSRVPNRPATTMAIDRFDWASRGPYGSLLLLLSMKRPHLVHLGAFVTVMMLGFSVFAQQAVTISLRTDMIITELSSIARAVNFAPLVGETRFVPERSYNPRRVDSWIESAMNLGMVADKVSLSDVSASCQGDLCSWPSYQTLALCSSVTELDPANFISVNSTDASTIQFSLKKVAQRYRESPMGGPDDPKAFRSMWMTTNLNRTYGPTHADRTPPVKWSWDIYIAYFSPCNDIEKDYLNFSRWKAYKGSLEFCIQKLHSEHNSSTKTNILSSKRGLEWPHGGEECINEGNDTFCQNGELGQHFSERFDIAFNGTASFSEVIGGASREYLPDRMARMEHYYSGEYSSNFMRDILGKNVTECKKDSSLGFAGFERRMKNLANALTNGLRTRDSTTAVPGITFKIVQFFAVEFRWMFLPGFLYIFATILLFCTIIVSGEGSIPLWKSSTLVLLHLMDRNNRLGYLRDVEKEAERTEVEFMDSGDNWYLQGKEEK